MNCPHCASTTPKERTKNTSLGYQTFRCESVPAHLQRAHRNPLQLPGISYRFRPPRRAVAASL
jgi:transposase-like protein